MAVNIDTFFRFTDFISNKTNFGNTLTIDQKNILANRAQMFVFEKDRAIFVSKEETSNFLSFFLTTKTYNNVSVVGEVVMPDNLQHITEVRSYYIKKDGKGMEVPVTEVKNADWGKITSSSLFAATQRFPKYSDYGNYIKVLPKSLKIITVDYFRTPVAPVWAYTISPSGRPVYDPINSVNFEWDEFAFNEVSAAFLQFVGVNLKDAELMKFSQEFSQISNSVL